nr:hypothetical protein [Tanacetum cinerariifolium]
RYPQRALCRVGQWPGIDGGGRSHAGREEPPDDAEHRIRQCDSARHAAGLPRGVEFDAGRCLAVVGAA